MAGGNPKGSSHKQPSSSSSSHRKSRWESGNNPPADQKPGASGDPKPSKPSSNPKENSTPPSAPTPSPGHPKTPADPIPKPLAGPGLIPPAAGAPLPDVAALGPPPPPTPTYGFHMLDRRTIVLADGSVRSYFALPPDYQDYAPPARPLDPAARFLPLGQGGHGPEPGGLGFDKRFQPGGVPFGREVFRDREDQFGRGRHQDYWNSLGLDGRGPVEGSLKRKFGDDEEERARREEKDSGKDEFARQRQQLLLHGNAGAIPNGFPPGVGGRVDLLAGTSSPYRRDLMDPGRGDELRSSKFMRMGGSFDSAGNKHYDVDPVALKKAYLHFVKMINENASQRKTYLENGNQGRPQCVVCGRSKDFPDMHGLIMHTYNYDNADMRVDHLGLHKALCVLMGWNYSKPPDNTKAYQFLSADEAAENQDDLIMWPPVVIIHNTITGKGKEGRMEGLGNKAMDNKLRDLGFGVGKAKSVYGRDGHLGITLVKFSNDMSGLKEAARLAEYFEKENHGRKGWACVQSNFGKDDEKNPNLVQVDEKTGEKKRIFYGYLGTASDLDKVDFDTRKRIGIESKREYMASK